MRAFGAGFRRLPVQGHLRKGQVLAPRCGWARLSKCSLQAVKDERIEDSKRPAETGIVAAWAACKPPERHQLLVLSVSTAVMNLSFGIVMPALPAITQELGLGATGLGLMMGAPGLARAICNLPAGVLVDRVGRVPGIVGGNLAQSLGCLGTAMMGSFVGMLPFRVTGGAGGSLTMAGLSAYQADITERSHVRPFRGTVVGAQGGLINIAYVTGPVVGGCLTAAYGPQAAYCLVAALMAGLAAAGRTLPEQVARSGSLVSQLRQLNAAELLSKAVKDWRVLLQDPNQQALFTVNLVVCLNIMASVTVMPLQVSQTLGSSAAELGALYSAGAVLGCMVSPLAGFLSDRYGRVALIPPALLVMSVGCCCTAMAQQWEFLIAGFAVWSVGKAIVAPVLLSYAADIAPKGKVGASLALSRQPGDLVFCIGAPLLGLFYDTCPGPAAMVCIAGFTVLGGRFFSRRARDATTIFR